MPENKTSKTAKKQKNQMTKAAAITSVKIHGWFIALLPVALLGLFVLDLFLDILPDMGTQANHLLNMVYMGTMSWCVLSDARILRDFFGAKKIKPGLWSFGTFMLIIISPIYMFVRMKYLEGKLRTMAKKQAIVSVCANGAYLFVLIVIVFVSLFLMTFAQVPKCQDSEVKQVFVELLQDAGVSDVEVGSVVEKNKEGNVRTCVAFDVKMKSTESDEVFVEPNIIYTVSTEDADLEHFWVKIPEQ